MPKTANPLRLSAAILTVAFTVAVNADDIVKDNDSLPDTSLSNATGAESVSRDSGDIVGGVDTVNIVDTFDNINAVDTVYKDSSATGKRSAHPKTNDEPPRLSGAHWGFGVGLSVGVVPIFHIWQRHLPDSLRHIGLSPAFAADTVADAATLRYRVTELPDAFNFAVPLSISLYNIGEKRVFSLTVSFFRNVKEFQSTLSIDSDVATRRIDILERLTYYSASIEAALRWTIPPIFFSINGSQQTLLTVALGASPVNAFTREDEIQTDFDDGDARMRAVADSVGKTLSALSGNGLSLSWRIGISVVKRHQSGYGSEIGLFYNGSYGGRFYSDGVRLTESHIKTRGADLNAQNVINGKPLSFLSNQAEFRATLLVPTRRGSDKQSYASVND